MAIKRRKLKYLLENTCDSRTYNLAFAHRDYYDWLEDKRNKNYNTYWRSRPYKNWKYNRKTQWKNPRD